MRQQRFKLLIKTVSKLLLTAGLVAVFLLVSPIRAEAKTGWVEKNKKWYYYGHKYDIIRGWFEVDGKWYHFDSTGAMEAGWINVDGYWYYLKPNGAMATGWIRIGSAWYYLDENGVMVNNAYQNGYWLDKNGRWDTRYNQGKWKKNSTGWWYQDGKWYPRNKWLWIDGYCYYFDNRGYLVTDQVIQGYRVDNSGAWVNDFGSRRTKTCQGKQFWWIALDKEEEDKRDAIDFVSQYSYEVIPLVDPFNIYYYIRTDNPDPSSFWIHDKDSKYKDPSLTMYEENKDPVKYYKNSIQVDTTLFADVKYEDSSIYRVKGGYIGWSSHGDVDGGEMVVQAILDTSCLINGVPEDSRAYVVDTDITLTLSDPGTAADYLVRNYGDPEKTFFENMDAIQEELNGLALYNGVFISGEYVKADCCLWDSEELQESFPGLASSPHADQNYYLRSTYRRLNSKPMLISWLYPFVLDSLGFPSMMWEVAKCLDPDAEVVWDPDYHYLVDVTWHGETRKYGGAGSGGGQGILESQIAYYFTFDGFGTDADSEMDMESLHDVICYYGTLDVPQFTDPDALTWAEIRNTVGTDGGYIRINMDNTTVDGAFVVVRGYSYIYDNGGSSEDTMGFADIGCMSNTWFDGRYFNKWEEVYSGVAFEETIDDIHPDLTFKDYQYDVGDLGIYNEKCVFDRYVTTQDAEGNITDSWEQYDLKDMGYDKETGIFTREGFVTFAYDEETGTWISPLIDEIYYQDPEQGGIRVELKNDPVYGERFVDACTITREEALEMGLDRNTNVDPEEYYIYDMTAEPGTFVSSSN